MKFSVIVVTYNSDIESIFLTLKSILKQDFTDYEIVISDDGSKDNHFPEIEHFFEEAGFESFELVPHERNQGTVKNLISALEHAKGEYVRDFGPGDIFYDEHTLKRLHHFFEKKKCDACFGLIRAYSKNGDGTVTERGYYHPFDIQAYRHPRRAGTERRILKNLILYSDNVSGACTSYKRAFYLSYLKKIEAYVVYEEDIFQVLSALEGKRMELFDDYVVWYEADTGVSTNKKSKFKELISQDVERFYDMLYERFPNQPYVRKRKRLSGFYRIKNLYVRTLLRFFVNPDAIRYLLISFIQRRAGKHAAVRERRGFLDDKDFG